MACTCFWYCLPWLRWWKSLLHGIQSPVRLWVLRVRSWPWFPEFFAEHGGTVLLVLTRDSTIGDIAFRFRLRWKRLAGPSPALMDDANTRVKECEGCRNGRRAGQHSIHVKQVDATFRLHRRTASHSRAGCPIYYCLLSARLGPFLFLPSYSFVAASVRDGFEARWFDIGQLDVRSHLELDQSFLERLRLQLTVR